ncbi:MAG: carbohydrate binding family 9 domain-containing protein, partial [Gemmatimonadota bacterium]|nr:carbohydrate binding family 9 domain-containing protein [Gemmatimonadota bacterium]
MKPITGKSPVVSAGKLAFGLITILVIAPTGSAQSIQAQESPLSASATKTVATATASSAERPPIIDGRDDDPLWKSATPITGFRVLDPKEDGDPTFQTEAKVGYDAENIYVFVRMFDPHPDSIVSLLSRRDVKTQSEQLKIMIDSYHDRRTGYEFAVNPAGVKRDYYTYDDSREDISWDAVWDVATRIDSLGWTAEFRIPLSQIRYPRAAEQTFGLMIVRDIARLSERDSWPLLRRSVRGIASQFGEVTGFQGLGSPHRLEVAPYVITKNRSTPQPSGFARTQKLTLGADIKYGLTSNVTLNATINPDFGQVEADPAQLNLTAFETFLAEQRPFFLEGTGIFSFAGDASRLFYSRRIGRSPQLAGLVGDPFADVPAATPILGAAKLTGRLSRGTSLGTVFAVTGQQSVGPTLIEPRTFYGVLRASQDFRNGESGIGTMFTVVNRDLDDPSALILRRQALTGGVDARHRFGSGRYSLQASLATSVVRGTATAIDRTQRNAVHFYNRPDAGLSYDPTRTSLSGTDIQLKADKVAGTFTYGGLYEQLSPGFETNDLGFLSQADQQIAQVYAALQSSQPRAFWRNASAQAYQYNQFTANGLPTTNWTELDLFAEFQNRMTFAANMWVDNLMTAYCDRCARGGPAVRSAPDANLLINVGGDLRRTVVPTFAAIYTVGDYGKSTLWRVRPYVTIRARSNLSWELGTRYQRNRNDTQWFTNLGVIGSDTTHYLFAHLDQELLSFTSRLNYTATTTVSLQLYAEPFLTTGRYFNVRELAAPRSASYDARYRPYPLPTDNASFNIKELHASAVARWEYRPGSTVFLVWTQGRDQDDRNAGSFVPTRDF